MKKTRRTEKTVEIHEIYAIRTASGSLPALCAECSTGDAIMLAPDHAALLSHVPTRMIYRLVETGSIHYRETPNGSLVVCVRTLVAARNQVIGTDNNT
ncbi:MAG TPA: hypothetical protein VN659_12680 [Pyrinomonadaceae bacterium]|nr:hypothetical protein [Pyrinomonadaceae bacterium]